jgi:hypothetical protein
MTLTTKVTNKALRLRLLRLEDRAVPSFGWASAVGGTEGNSVATDAAGNVYMTGSFTGSFTPAGSATPLTSAGGSDIFVTKYSQNGSFQWATSMGGTQTDQSWGRDQGWGIAADNNGNVFVVGSYIATATFGTINLTSPYTSPSAKYPDAFLAKLDATTGSVTWARNGLVQFSSAYVVSGAGVAVDTAGNAFLTTSTGASHLTVSRVTSSGSLNWQYPFNTAEAVSGGIAVSGGNVYVTGDFFGNVDFDPGPGNARLKSGNNSTSGFVLKMTTTGSYVWARAFASSNGNANICAPASIGVDSAGNVYTSGSFTGTVDFNPGSPTLNFSGGTGAGFVTKLNSSGNFVWAKQYAVPLGGETSIWGPIGLGGTMTVDAAGSVYLTGGFTGTADFNPNAGVNNLTSVGGSDIFVSKLDTNGAFLWAVRAGGLGDDCGFGIAVDPFGNINTTGYISAGTTDFDPANTYGDNRDLITATERTGFLWQIEQP